MIGVTGSYWCTGMLQARYSKGLPAWRSALSLEIEMRS